MIPVTDQVRSYVQNPVDPEPLAKSIICAIQALATPLEKWTLTQQISREWKKVDQQVTQGLKAALIQAGWKTSLLGIEYQTNVDIHSHFLCYTNNLDCSLDFESRTQFFSKPPIQGMVGSTFATNKPDRLDTQGHHILDSFFACECAAGHILALADGAGGHFGDLRQDKNIARASHLATKTCARLFAAYDDPQELHENLLSVLSVVAKEIHAKAGGEGSTLAACRLYQTNQGWRLIGLNVGDTMLIAWHPPTKKIFQIFPSCVTEAGTAFLPFAYRSFEVQTIDTMLPPDSCVFLMSDGVHDQLPFIEVEKIYPNDLRYRIRTLTHLESILISPETALQTLVKACMQNAEQERQNCHESNIQMGDDLSLLHCTLGELDEHSPL